MRLARYLSQAGVTSRRKAEELIVSGRVTVGGKVVTDVATNVDEDSARVAVDGQGIQLEELVYIVLNKPKGCVSTVSDPEGRPTVMDYLPRVKAAVKPVGRLDYHSEGVLLLTNDGELAARLLARDSHVAKSYHVKVQGRVSDAVIARLRAGVRLDDGYQTRPAQVDRLKAPSKHDWLVITLHEGKNRQIHRMLEAVGFRVSKIQRVAFGTLTFHGLRVGDARELDAAELKELRALVALKANPRAQARGKWKAKREDTDRARRARARKLEEQAAPDEAAPPREKKSGRRSPEASSPKPGARSPKPKPGARSPKPKPGARSPKPKPGARSPKPGARSPKPKPGARSPKPGGGQRARSPRKKRS